MRYDDAKSFPYPVLRQGSRDYIDGAFQATIRWALSKDTQTIQIDARCQLSEPAIRKLIGAGRAVYAILLESRETYFRDLICSSVPMITAKYDGGRVKGQVELLPFVVATDDIFEFSSEWFNPEYGSQAFEFSAGDVLALDAPKSFYVGQEVFAPIGSVFELVEEDGIPTGEVRLDLDGERVQIRVSSEQKELLDTARGQKELRPLLLSGIYLPTLMQVISHIVKGPEEFADRKWFRSIKAKCDVVGVRLDDSIEPLAIAQQLLQYPLVAMNKSYFAGD